MDVISGVKMPSTSPTIVYIGDELGDVTTSGLKVVNITGTESRMTICETKLRLQEIEKHKPSMRPMNRAERRAEKFKRGTRNR